MARILSIGPDPSMLAARSRELALCGHCVHNAETRADALHLAGSGIFDVLLLCDQFLPAYAAQLADELHLLAPKAIIILLAGGSTKSTITEIQAAIMSGRQAA